MGLIRNRHCPAHQGAYTESRHYQLAPDWELLDAIAEDRDRNAPTDFSPTFRKNQGAAATSMKFLRTKTESNSFSGGCCHETSVPPAVIETELPGDATSAEIS
jgi:hypothetical protein